MIDLKAYLFCFSAVVFVYLPLTSSKYIDGILQTSSEDWKFLNRFCFLPEMGSIQYNFEYPNSYAIQSLLLYWDRPNLWESVYGKNRPCAERESHLEEENYQIFRLHPSYPSFCKLNSSTQLISCQSPEFSFKSARARWWFLAISNCLSKKGLYLKYEIWMRNGEIGDRFREHFSADEMYILETSLAFLFLQLLLLFLTAYVAIQLKKKQLFHTTYKLFLSSVVVFLFSIFFNIITYGSYGISGRKSLFLSYVSAGLYSAALVVFILMLLMLSVGYTITCGRLPNWITILISVFMTAFIITYISLFVLEIVTFDPGYVLYRYESQAGYGVCGLICVAWLLYLGFCIYTFIRHKKKRLFYIPMMIFFTVWFLAIPICVVVAIFVIPPWMRLKVVNGVELTILFSAQLFYLVLTRPTAANKNFPFKIRTTQIDAVAFEAADANAHEEEKADLPDGANFTDFSIFTVSNMRSNGDSGVGTSLQRAPSFQSNATNSARSSGRTHPVSDARGSPGSESKLIQPSPVYEEIPDGVDDTGGFTRGHGIYNNSPYPSMGVGSLSARSTTPDTDFPRNQWRPGTLSHA